VGADPDPAGGGGIAHGGMGASAPIFSIRFQSLADPDDFQYVSLKTSGRNMRIPEKDRDCYIPLVLKSNFPVERLVREPYLTAENNGWVLLLVSSSGHISCVPVLLSTNQAQEQGSTLF